MRHIFIVFVLVFGLHSSVLFAADVVPQAAGSIQKFQYKKALEESQKAIGNQLSNFRLTDASGKGITLHELNGKPVILSLVYTSCYQICPMTTKHLSTVVEKARKALGQDSFSVAVLGFDSQFDSPQAMLSFARKCSAKSSIPF